MSSFHRVTHLFVGIAKLGVQSLAVSRAKCRNTLISFQTQCRAMSGSGEVSSRVMSNEDWISNWDKGQTGFHNEYINPALENHVSKMLNGRSNTKVFIPLCGKAWDMKWLADQGHTVVGVEVAQQAIEDFFKEQKIAFTSEPAPAVDGTLFQSEDKKLQLYCCDLFKFNKDVAGQMDCIFDRGSLVAINNCDRDRYAVLLKSLMAPDCRYLLSILQYDETKYPGPPHHVGDAVILQLYEDAYTVTEIDNTDVLEERHQKWGIDALNEKVFLIAPK